jgi:pimeloyl-ACP methyl ester carboxylesterase
VTTQAQDVVTLAGRLYDNDSDTTVVVLHRYDGSSQEDFLYGTYFGDCNLLLTDARNHGESGGDACSFGALEQYDLVSWLEWIQNNLGQQKVILYGEDMGASTALLASEHGLLPDNVAFIVADSPYTSLADIADYAMSKWYKIPKALTHFMGRMSDQADNGFQVAEADALSGAAQGSCPVLFLLGEDNEYIPATETQALYNSWGGEKELFSCDSRNGLIYAEHVEEIQTILDQWMERYL